MTKKIESQIHQISIGKFSSELVESFLSRFKILLNGETPLDYFLQISTDQGNELELGFFTNSRIVDVTLSQGKVYFCSYPIASILHIGRFDSNTKCTLVIQGEKKFDYNVLKPGSTEELERYENSLKQHKLFTVPPQKPFP